MGNPREIGKVPRMSRRDFLTKAFPFLVGTVALGLLPRNPNIAAAQPPSPLPRPTPRQPDSPLTPPVKKHELPFDPQSLLDGSKRLDVEPSPEIIGPRPLASEVVFEHYDWRSRNPDDYPELEGRIGSELVLPWTDIHRGPNDYDWEPIDSYLRAIVQNNYKVRIVGPDGKEKEIYKPVIFCPVIYLSATPGAPYIFDVRIPQFVKDQAAGGVYTFQASQADCPVQLAPKYDSAVVQQHYFDFMQAFFERYGNMVFEGTDQLVIAGVEANPWGLDMENGNETKNIWAPKAGGGYVYCRYVDALKAILPYWTYLANSDSILFRVLAIASETNSLIPITSLYTSDGKFSAYDRIIDHSAARVGQATGSWDGGNWKQIVGDGRNVGVEAIFKRANENGVPTVIETAVNNPLLEEAYNTLYAMWAVAHSERVAFLAGFLAAVKANPTLAETTRRLMLCIGRTESTAPIVWYKANSTAFPSRRIGSVTYGGHEGPFTWGLRQVNIPGMTPTIQYGDRQMAEGWRTPPNPPLPAPAKNEIYGLRAERAAPGSPFVGFEVNKQWYVNHRQFPNSGAFDLSVRIINNYEHGPQPMTVMFVNGTTGEVETRTINTGPELGQNNSFVEVKIPLWDARFRGEFQDGADFMIYAGGEGNLTFESLHLTPSKIYNQRFPFGVVANNPFPFAAPGR